MKRGNGRGPALKRRKIKSQHASVPKPVASGSAQDPVLLQDSDDDIKEALCQESKYDGFLPVPRPTINVPKSETSVFSGFYSKQSWNFGIENPSLELVVYLQNIFWFNLDIN